MSFLHNPLTFGGQPDRGSPYFRDQRCREGRFWSKPTPVPLVATSFAPLFAPHDSHVLHRTSFPSFHSSMATYLESYSLPRA
jgi:membrane-associated phospholipid phosphatase